MPLIDALGRKIDYLRLSVTDRCDLRCRYCMSEQMTFLPKQDLLSLEEIARAAEALVDRGIRKIRLTGGEPLVRRNMGWLISYLGELKKAGHLDELTLTTNATQLPRHAETLAQAGVARINVSLDSLDPARYSRITRLGILDQALNGILAAQQVGIRVKLNTVVMKGINDHELPDLVQFAHGNGMDICLIETMPLGENMADRRAQYLPLEEVKKRFAQHWTLIPTAARTAGPARYEQVSETGGRIGFISPMSHNFCGDCNRIRLSCSGKLYMCLGSDTHVDLAPALRKICGNGGTFLDAALDRAMTTKPRRHGFDFTETPLARHMSATGG